MHKNRDKRESSDRSQSIITAACGLILMAAVQGCATKEADYVGSEDAALKGGIPANDHGRGRPGADAAGASGAVDSDDRDGSADRDAAVDDQCETGGDVKGKSAMHAKDSAASNTGKTMSEKCHGMPRGARPEISDKGQSGMRGRGKPAADAGAPRDDQDENKDKDKDQDSDEQS
jgi:hypothetical protein